MIYSVHQPQYLPWLGFFDKIDKSDCFVFLDDVQYKHREFQNRNKIRTKDGWMWLTVSVCYERGENIREVKIDNSRDWAGAHLKSLKSWYARAEFFSEHIAFFETLYSQKQGRLLDLNVAVIKYLLEVLSIKKKIYFESELAAGGEKTARIINIGNKLGARTYLSGSGGKDYLREEEFVEAGIKLEYQEFKHPVYKQQHCESVKDFMSFMSAIDLLFNEGARSIDILRAGRS
jgi:hypothetical protein